MKIRDIFGTAFSTFANNKMRTLLTIFGVSIGIGAIVFLVSIGYGLQEITVGEIKSIKALSTFNVTSGNSALLSLNDEALSKFKALPNVASVNENLAMSGQIGYQNTKTDILVNAVSAEYAELDDPKMQVGQIFKPDSRSDIVITALVANAFNQKPEDMVGKKVKLNYYMPNPENEKNMTMKEGEFNVVGVIKDNVTSYVYVPIKSIEIPAGSKYSTIKVKINDVNNMSEVKDKLVDMGFRASSIGERITQMNRVFDITKIVLLVLGAIAMIVASIGMFNTLTISLLERTRDIGIMKALGATDREIYFIFLTEATIISLAGGIFGITLAFILGEAVNITVSTLAIRAGGDKVDIFQAPMMFIAIILGFSLIVGFLTGLYPSKRAAKLNPLDALRYE